MQEIKGDVQNIIFRNEDTGFAVLELLTTDDDEITAVGVMPHVREGEQVVLQGSFTEHRDYGPQFKVQACSSSAPKSLLGLKRYLASGFIPGVGPATAEAIVTAFGEDTLRVMQEEPRKLSQIRGITEKKADAIQAAFDQQVGMRDVLIELEQYDITARQAVKLYRIYGANTLGSLRSDPYRIIEDVEGIGFKTADRIAMSMGVELFHPKRLEAGLLHVMSLSQNEGHTYLPKDVLLDYGAKTLGVEAGHAREAMMSLCMEQKLVIQEMEDGDGIYLPYALQSEQFCARALLLLSGALRAEPDSILREIEALEENMGITFNKEQRSAVVSALSHGVCVITGGPGTGKTTLLHVLIRLFEKRQLKVALCAPTGRAAKRMQQSSGYDASTIHRLLEFRYETGGFSRDEENPVEADVVVVDEVSMLDVYLLHGLLRGLKPGTRLIMLGDADQLPSVGPGNVLSDMIGSNEIAVAQLHEIFRSKMQSGVVINAHRIQNGEMPDLKGTYPDFRAAAIETSSQVLSALKKILAQEEFQGFDTHTQIQVLTPTRKGELGVTNLNAELQKVMNPPDTRKQELNFMGRTFRVGDKIMQIKNNYQIVWQRGPERGEGVFNGDMGYVDGIDDTNQTLRVFFDDEREVEYPYDMLEELEHAFAISVHKSQGSEFDMVLLPLCGGPAPLLTRNLLYTAVTRAKKMVYIIGRGGTVYAMVKNNRMRKRFSGLKQSLKETAFLVKGL